MAADKRTNGKAALRYIPCRIEPGMFRGEFLVYLDALHPNNPENPVKAQLFVDERDVAGIRDKPERNRPVGAWLVVSLVRTGHGFAQIVLPQPAQPFGETLLISEDQLKLEAGA